MSPSDTVVFRIARKTRHYSPEDLGGGGALRFAGRWNHAQTPMVYASSSRALAALETLVHIRDAAGMALPLDRYLVAIALAPDLWAARETLAPATQPGWDSPLPGHASRDWGTAWAREHRSLIAIVPSVIVPEEANILLNPRHPDARRLQARVVRQWLYDPRL